jgi:uracil-DNA glycosylase family 4
MQPNSAAADPPRDCNLCPRLHDFVAEWRSREPAWHNGPVQTWRDPAGDGAVRLLIVGLAPGLRGANRTGRPFTGDFSGDLLYATLLKSGLARGRFGGRPDDSLELVATAITNAVRCVPPQNRPTATEVNTCRKFLRATIGRFAELRAILTLGRIAHDTTVRALDGRVAAYPFGHGAKADIGGIRVFSSYHCSRYNINTGVLTTAMFENIINEVAAFLQD